LRQQTNSLPGKNLKSKKSGRETAKEEGERRKGPSSGLKNEQKAEKGKGTKKAKMRGPASREGEKGETADNLWTSHPKPRPTVAEKVEGRKKDCMASGDLLRAWGGRKKCLQGKEK